MDENRWSVVLGHGLGDIELGTPRSVLLQRLTDAELDFETDEDNPAHVYVSETDMQLTFSSGEPPVLVQIATDNDCVRFGSKPVLGCRLHEITALLQVNAEETVWRLDDDPECSLPSASQMRLSRASDEDLLLRGTLWIRPLGLGLNLWRGEIREVYLRQPEQMPNMGVGCLTPLQLEFSQRKELPAELARPQQTAARVRRWFRLVSGAIFFALIAVVVLQAAAYQRRWQESSKVEAEVVAVGPGGPDTVATEFTVTYRDQNGVERQANLGLADVYVPKKVGEKVELRYLPEKPDQPLGPGRVHDAAFVKFFPYAIAILAGYLVTQVAGAIIVKLVAKPTALSA